MHFPTSQEYFFNIFFYAWFNLIPSMSSTQENSISFKDVSLFWIFSDIQPKPLFSLTLFQNSSKDAKSQRPTF